MKTVHQIIYRYTRISLVLRIFIGLVIFFEPCGPILYDAVA